MADAGVCIGSCCPVARAVRSKLVAKRGVPGSNSRASSMLIAPAGAEVLAESHRTLLQSRRRDFGVSETRGEVKRAAMPYQTVVRGRQTGVSTTSIIHPIARFRSLEFGLRRIPCEADCVSGHSAQATLPAPEAPAGWRLPAARRVRLLGRVSALPSWLGPGTCEDVHRITIGRKICFVSPKTAKCEKWLTVAVMTPDAGSSRLGSLVQLPRFNHHRLRLPGIVAPVSVLL